MEGKTLEALFPGRDLTPMRERMRGLMQEAGLPYGERTHTYNSRLAQELAKWAETRLASESVDLLHRKLYEAYFVDGKNIADHDVLVALAESVNLEPNEVREVLQSRSFEAEVDSDWQLAYEQGISGVPTFSAKDMVVVGCQPYETLEKFVLHLQSLED